MSLETATVLDETAKDIINHDASLSFFVAIPWVSLNTHVQEILTILAIKDSFLHVKQYINQWKLNML